MSYSGEIKKIAEWIRKETRVRQIVFNKEPVSISSGGISARIVYLGDENIEIKKDFRYINLNLRLSASAADWYDVLDTAQTIQNNLLREREYDVKFDSIENPDGSDVEGSDFTVDMPLSITVSTGKVAL